jgi:hypothetical protein
MTVGITVGVSIGSFGADVNGMVSGKVVGVDIILSTIEGDKNTPEIILKPKNIQQRFSTRQKI